MHCLYEQEHQPMNMSFKASFFLSAAFLIPSIACSPTKKSNDSTNGASGTVTDKACAALTTPVTLSSFAMAEYKLQFFESAQSIVRDLIPEPIQIHADENSFIERGGARHANFKFTLDGFPLCQYEARVHSLADKTYVVGRLPNAIDNYSLPEPMTLEASDIDRVLAELKLEGNAKVSSDQNCLVWEDNELVASREIHFNIRDYPYYALLSKEKVFSAQGRFFDASTVTVEAQVNVKEPIASTNLAIQTITLTGMSSGGTLCNSRFETIVPTTSEKAKSTNLQFFFEPTDMRFKETSIFVNITLHSDWFLELGILSAWPGPKINLLMDGNNNFVNNSSVYLPSDGASAPTIKLGGGDNKNLQNLYIDSDVVAHELGHHVVYQFLKDTTGESLVLHEGIADYFVYGQTNDPCLGRLICPTGSTICYSKQCLRTGLFPKNFGEAGVPTEPHRLSQVISSLLWDIGNGNTTSGITGIGLDIATKDILKAVDFLPSSASYSDFISAIMKADKALNESKNCATIESAAKARGLTAALASANVSCATVK
jgi:hypothetical protein